jgi:hypothetical protein
MDSGATRRRITGSQAVDFQRVAAALPTRFLAMNYHLSQGGQDVGVFPIEELRRRRDAGELTGNEPVWREGMAQWQPLNSVLQQAPPKFIAPPPLPPGVEKRGRNPAVVAVLVVVVGIVVVGAVALGTMGYRAYRLVSPAIQQAESGEPASRSSAMAAASRPAVWTTNTRTHADVQRAAREFRVRQYIVGYQQRGQRNPECDLLAQQFLTNWIACNYGGIVDTNLPSLADLSDRLANDPACSDPLVLTVAAVNGAELHESLRRLERAVKGFENSSHRGYPKLYATLELEDKMIQDRSDRQPVLDAQALKYLKEAFTDGSLLPDDQAEMAEILINGWGRNFFFRNAVAVYSLAQDQGNDYRWLALVLKGENEISVAWRARGGGFTDTVSEKGWKGFSDHLATARECLTEAWKLQPNLPLAPCRMIYVSLGDSDIGEMRKWFDRTTTAQIDYAEAWSDMRWGLRPRWNGDYDSMLAFGVTALKTRRFDTDVPRMFFDSLADLESEMELPQGQHIYSREDIWPHLQELYEGYIAEPSLDSYSRDGWRSTYAVVATLAGKYDAARKELDAVQWQPHGSCLTGWNRDLSLLPQEVAARTGVEASQVNEAEIARENGDVAGALKIYKGLPPSTNGDAWTDLFVRDRVATLSVEQRLKAGEWADFLPTDTNFTGWHIGFGKFKVLPDGALEVQSDQYGHLIYSRVRVGMNFEVRGEFEVVSSSTKAFQGGLVMGVPEWESYNWYAFRIKRNTDEGDVSSFSQHWTKRQIRSPVPLDSRTNSFDFRLHGGRISATVDGREVFKDVEPPKDAYVTTNEFWLGLGAFNDSNSTVIRYRNVQARLLPAP